MDEIREEIRKTKNPDQKTKLREKVKRRTEKLTQYIQGMFEEKTLENSRIKIQNIIENLHKQKILIIK